MTKHFSLGPCTVGELVERVILLVGRTGWRLLGLTVLVVIPLAPLVGLTFNSFIVLFVGAAESLSGLGEFSPVVAERFSKAMGYLGLTAFFLVLAEMLIFIGGQLITCGELFGRRIDLREALQLMVAGRTARAVFQRILAELVIISLVLMPYALLLTSLGSGGVALINVGLLMLAVVVALLLRVRWAFATTAIVWEDMSIGASLARSVELVKGNGLRLLLLLAMFVIAFTLFASMLKSPFQLLAVWPSLSEVMQAGGSGDPAAAFRLLSELGVWYGLVSALGQLLVGAARSVYIPVLYVDVRARRGEFDAD